MRDWCSRTGFSVVDSTKLVTAASELGRNVLVHGHGGSMTIMELCEDGCMGLRLVFADTGEGIPDVQLAMTDGYSSTRSMGMGLGGAKRLVNEFELATTPGAGTTVTVARWKRR